MASYAVKKRTDGKKKHYYWNDYRFEGGKIVKYRRIILVYFDGEKRCRCERRIYVGDKVKIFQKIIRIKIRHTSKSPRIDCKKQFMQGLFL